MYIKKYSIPTNHHRFNTKLTTLACLMAGIFSAQVQANNMYGCEADSIYSTDGTNGCSISIGLNENVDGMVIGGSSTNGTTNNNNVTISQGAKITDSIYGGFTSKKEANYNSVIIGNDVQANGSITGGASVYSTADFNTVRIGTNTTVTGSVDGGNAGSNNQAVANNVSASSNTIHIGDLSKISDYIYGGSGGKQLLLMKSILVMAYKLGKQLV